MSIISAVRRLRQEDSKFHKSLNYIVRLYPKTNKQKLVKRIKKQSSN
jgi:hypothetical protein